MSNLNIHIGTIIGVVGIKGQLKVKTYLSQSKIIDSFGSVMIETLSNKININFIREQKGNAIISLNKITTRNQAESLINKRIFINKKQLPLLNKNEYYINDLIGFLVETISKKKLGIVKNINYFGADDLIEIKQKNNN